MLSEKELQGILCKTKHIVIVIKFVPHENQNANDDYLHFIPAGNCSLDSCYRILDNMPQFVSHFRATDANNLWISFLCFFFVVDVVVDNLLR